MVEDMEEAPANLSNEEAEETRQWAWLRNGGGEEHMQQEQRQQEVGVVDEQMQLASLREGSCILHGKILQELWNGEDGECPQE